MRNYSPTEAHAAWQAGDVALVDCRERVEHEVTRIAGVPLVRSSYEADRVADALAIPA